MVSILSVAVKFPLKIKTVEDILENTILFDEIIKNSGIESIMEASDQDTVISLGTVATKNALDNCGFDSQELNQLVFISEGISDYLYMDTSKTKEVIPYMMSQKFGRIINISSIAGERGVIAQSNYSASKSAINGLTKSLAKELGPYGITVNAVVPGLIETEMIEAIPERILEKTVKMIPLKRIGMPEEVAQAVAFLISDKASYCNGTFLNIDGGLRI